MNREFGTQAYLRPLFKQLTLQPARSYLLNLAQEFLRMISRTRKHNEQPSPPRTYQPPQLTKLTPEQAKLKLLGHLSLGDEGAKDLLDLLFSGPAGAQPAQREPQERPTNSLGRTG